MGRRRGALQGDGPDRHPAQRVRAKPNGKIIGTLANGTLVAVVDHADDANGKPWVKVEAFTTKKPTGWVFREFISCF